jgi:hypothetical protein
VSSELKKCSRSNFFPVPDGAYKFSIHKSPYLTPIPRPDGIFLVSEMYIPSLTAMAVPRLSVPIFKYVA